MLSANTFFFLLIGILLLQYTSQEKQIRGTPEVDYPTYYVIPKTSFRCSDQLYNPGFYADTETRCQVFHYCFEHRQDSFLCPMGTIFNQPLLTCDYWYSSNCSLATSYYHVNAVKRNEEFFDVDDSIDYQSENVFDKMSHLYEINNKTPESPNQMNNLDTPEKESPGSDGFVAPDEPLNEKHNKIEDYDKYNYDNFNMIDEKHPEIVKYEAVGLDTLNILDGSETEQYYDTNNENDFILSEDGKLHSSQEDIHQSYPTDMNFDQEYSGYAEMPTNENFDFESDYPMMDSDLQKRYSISNGDYVRKPLRRKPVLVIPDPEPQIVQLPSMKHKRKPIMASTISTDEDANSSHETTYDSIIQNEHTESSVSDDFEGPYSSEFPLDEPGLNSNYVFNDPKLFYENPEQVNYQMQQNENSNLVYDYSTDKNTRNEFVFSNNVEDEASIFGSGGNDFIGISNAEHQNTLNDLNRDENLEGSIVYPVESSDPMVEGNFDSDPFFGSGLEENAIRHHSSDGLNLFEDQYIYSDKDDTDTTDSETSFVLPVNISDTSEEYEYPRQEYTNMFNFAEETNEPVSKDNSDGSMDYGEESSFSSETFENFPPSESSEEHEVEDTVSDGSGELSEFNNLPPELQEYYNRFRDSSDKVVPEIQEIDGEYYYVFPDPEFHSKSEKADSSEFYSENDDYIVPENYDGADETSEELVDIAGSQYVTVDSKLQTNDIEELPHELVMESASHINEEYLVDDNESVGQLSTEDLSFLEMMAQTPIPMPKNLFEVSNEKAGSDFAAEETSHIKNISLEQDMDETVSNHEHQESLEDIHESESFSFDASKDIEEHSVNMNSSDVNSEFSDTEDNAEEEVSQMDGSGENELDSISPEEKVDVFVLGKEGDPFNPLFTESDEMLLGSPESDQDSSLKIDPVKPKSPVITPAKEKNLKTAARGKRLNENLRTFNPSSRDNPAIPSTRATHRETIFSNIPSTFLKMKHSTLSPYFYDSDIKKSGVNPRSGGLSEPSRISKLTAMGKRLLASKQSKFNAMKKYVDSYRYN